jgi:AraC-like DNA-binding protein
MRFPFEKKAKGIWPRVLWLGFVKGENSNIGIFEGHHRHSFYEAHFLFSGEISYSLSNEICVKAGEGLLITPEADHRYTDSKGEILKLSFAFELGEDSPFSSFLGRESSHPFKITEEMLESVNAILRETERDNTLSFEIIMNRVYELFYNLLVALSVPLPKGDIYKKTGDTRYKSAVRFIESNLGGNLTLEEIGTECGISVRQLNRIMKEQTGKSLSQYINAEKIKASENLLLKTNLPISEISRRLGFESDYYFRKFFKRHTGLPPVLFRKKNSDN